jgi:hypothetical protein
VLAETEHPILSDKRTGPGSKPRIDFGITGTGNVLSLAIETKWLSGSTNLVRDIVRDIIRLDLLVPRYAESGLLLVAGEARDFQSLFQREDFSGPNPKRPSGPLLPIYRTTGTLNLRNPESTPPRVAFFQRVLTVFDGIEVNQRIPLVRSGPYPTDARARDFQVYIWRLRSFSG